MAKTADEFRKRVMGDAQAGSAHKGSAPGIDRFKVKTFTGKRTEAFDDQGLNQVESSQYAAFRHAEATRLEGQGFITAAGRTDLATQADVDMLKGKRGSGGFGSRAKTTAPTKVAAPAPAMTVSTSKVGEPVANPLQRKTVRKRTGLKV